MTLAGLAPGITVEAARRALARAFRAAGLETPELDARVLVGHALALDHTGLAQNAARLLSAEEARAIAGLGARRLAHEPVSRIRGFKEFWSLPLAVTSAVLAPRPESETVVEQALALIDATGARSRPLRIADLGTGSAALLLALLSELPRAFGVGTDSSLAALDTACRNARAVGLAARARFVACDFGAALTACDLVVSNPPYVSRAEIAALPPEVRDHTPHLALDGGADGLDAYRAIAADARRLVAPGGHLVVELGAGQEEAVKSLFEQAGLEVVPARPDLAGIARALGARHAGQGNFRPRHSGKKALGLWGKTD